MPSVIQINGKWRAQVRRKGVRPATKTFPTEGEARDWAEREEKRVRQVVKGVMHDPMMRPTPYRVAGVYMLFRGAELRHIGRSVSIYRRMNDHDRTNKDWDSFRIFPCSDWAEAAALERKLIEKHRPPLNVAGVSLDAA